MAHDDMRQVPLADIVRYLDEELHVSATPDYPGAINGLQVENNGTVRRVAVAVDASILTIQGAIEVDADLLVVHHGLFWSGVQPIRGRTYERIRRLIRHDVAVYSAHLPLDMHPRLGNNSLFAKALGLDPTEGFARYQGTTVGVMGNSDVETTTLAERAEEISRREGGSLITVGVAEGRRTRRWALCTGAGASSETIREAAAAGADTLIVGEGPHHSAIDAAELGIAVLYAGHYATETLGVRALGEELQRQFDLPWSFIASPTGL